MRNLFIAAVLLSSGVASAQSNPMSYEAMSKAKQGTWAEYTMTMPGGAANKMTVRYAVVEKNEREMTMETDSQTPVGPVHSSMTFAPLPPDTWKLVKARMQMGTTPAQDVPAAKLTEGSVKKTDTPGKLVGAEKITVPAGTFDTKHYKNQLPKEAGGMTLDVWMSDKAVPTGVVKMSGAGGIEMVLSSTGSGAKAKPEAKPAAAPPSGEKAAPKSDAPASKK
ncbi:MAG: hypothetical protein JWM53_5677 [bacterium]|nr:hypothetical protein [bacterium]